MKVKIERGLTKTKVTFGKLYIDGVFQCYTLEDEIRDVKKYGDTAIWAGKYKLDLRKAGRMHEKYSKKFPFHKGMLHILDIPQFKWVYIHIGNKEEHTLGCPLVGMLPNYESNFLGRSTEAYKKIYPIIANAIESGEDVELEIVNL